MYDGVKVTIGLIVFFVFFTSPFFYNMTLGRGKEAPTPPIPAGKTECAYPQELKDSLHAKHFGHLADPRRITGSEEEKKAAELAWEAAETTYKAELSTWMRANHMDMLNTWRDGVVREGGRSLITVSGQQYEKSLSEACLSCHESNEAFCQECHNYVGVEPYCWDCHLDTRSGK